VQEAEMAEQKPKAVDQIPTAQTSKSTETDASPTPQDSRSTEAPVVPTPVAHEVPATPSGPEARPAPQTGVKDSGQSSNVSDDTRTAFITAVGVILGFAFIYISQWANGDEPWVAEDKWPGGLFIVSVIIFVIILGVGLIPNLERKIYNYSVGFFMLGLTLLAAGVGVGLYIDYLQAKQFTQVQNNNVVVIDASCLGSAQPATLQGSDAKVIVFDGKCVK
jgi:hypothetical protein